MDKTQYAGILEQAPPLQIKGLEAGYRLLAEFNDIVLAGRSTHYGFEFVTWNRDYAKTGLCWGHYFGEEFERAKMDFAIRAGLVPQDRILSSEQLAEVYRSVHETLDSEYPMTMGREQLLKDIAAQIEQAVPNLDELVQKSNEAELLVQGRTDTPGMTQQF